MDKETLRAELRDELLAIALADACERHGVVESAWADVGELASGEFTLTAEHAITNAHGQTVDAWIYAMRCDPKRGHLFPRSVGAGIGQRNSVDGFDTGGNPWSREQWNLTQQGAIVRQDSARAERLRIAAWSESMNDPRAPADIRPRAAPTYPKPPIFPLPAPPAASPTYLSAATAIGSVLDAASIKTDAGAALVRAGQLIETLSKKLLADLEGIRADPALNETQRYVEYVERLSSRVAAAADKLDEARGAINGKIDELEAQYLARLRANNPAGITGAEVRQLLRAMQTDGARVNYVSTAASAGDGATIAAFVTSAPHQLGMQREMFAGVVEDVRDRMAPEYADARRRLITARAMFERNGGAFLRVFAPTALDELRAAEIKGKLERGRNARQL